VGVLFTFQHSSMFLCDLCASVVNQETGESGD
jgi:hypothetical protein